MENKFFTFLDPILKLIDDGAFFRKPFRWLYMLLAALNLLVPIGVLVAAIDNQGCGMTRALFSLLHLDFTAAWNYNRLVIIVAPLLLYLYVKEVAKTIGELR